MGELKLTEQFEAIIHRQVESGRYGSAAEVVEAGLALLEGLDKLDIDELEVLRATINDAFDDGTDDMSIEAAFESVEGLHVLDKAASHS